MSPHGTYLTDRFLLLLGFVQLIAVMSVLFPAILIVYLILVGILVSLAIIERRALTGADTAIAELEVPHMPELGEHLALTCALFSPAARPIAPSRLRLIPPHSTCLTFLHNRIPLSAAPCENGIRYEAPLIATAATLGYEELPSVTLLAHSPLWVWFRRIPVPIRRCRFRVIPTRRHISKQAFTELKACQQLLIKGSRQIIRGRMPDQFHSIRKYQFPDPIRHIDPKKTAKFNTLMTRVYDSIYSHHVILAMDVGRAMCGDLSESHKHDFYLAACLELARHSILSQDRVSWVAFSQKIHHVIAHTQRMDPFEPLFRGHPAIQPKEVESNFELLSQTISRLAGQRSIVIILTDPSKPSVQEALLEMLPSMCRRHLTCVVGLVDESYALTHQIATTQLSANPTQAADTYAGLLYTYWLDERVDLFRRKIAQLGGGVLVVSQSDWLSVIIRLHALLRTSLSI